MIFPLFPTKNHEYLEGQGDLATRLMMGMIGVTIWVTRVIGVINLLTKSPCPSK